MIAAQAHLHMGCPTDGTYNVFRNGDEYHVEVKYITGYGPTRSPVHAPDRGALVVLDKEAKLIRIDKNHLPGTALPAVAEPEQAVASDSTSPPVPTS
jgi:hypothetical protein